MLDEFLQYRIFYRNLVIKIHHLVFGREKLVKIYKMTTFLWRYKRRHEYNELERIVKVSINAKDKMLIVELLPYKLH